MNYKEFQNPGNELRGKPFWSWNGKLDKDELIRQIHVIKDMGFGGFFMHSRTGLNTEYLGDEWFDLINACADEGEKLGLEAWLYDEDRWPSGTAGGMVTQKEENQMKYLHTRLVKKEDYPSEDGLLAAFGVKLDGINLSEYKKITSDKDLEGFDTVMECKIKPMDKSSFYNGFTYVDTLRKETTEEFIQMTHQKYKEKCGDRIGSSIKGIFTDEPHHGMVNSDFGINKPQDENMFPFDYGYAPAFKEVYGYDITDRLPELIYRMNGEKVAPIKWQYMELLQELFLSNFAAPIKEWCEKNNMHFTGHFLHEDTLACQSIPQGSIMRAHEMMDYPGVDLLTEGNRCYCVAKQLQSVARQTGKKWLLSELYGCTGWQMGFQSHKAVGDWQALYGINVRCHHLSWYTMEGEAKRDYPASIFHQSPWYKEYRQVEEYFARLNYVLMQGSPVCDVLYITPVESLWAEVGQGWAAGLGVVYPELQKIEEIYANIWNWLLSTNTDFDFGDEDMMRRLASVEMENGTTYLRVGNAKYKQVLISGMTTMRASTLNLLKEFSEKGGRIVFAGNAPAYIDCEKNDAAINLSKTAENVAIDKDAIVSALSDNAAKNLVSASSDIILTQARMDGDTVYVVLMSNDRVNDVNGVTVKINHPGYVQKWDALTGNRYACGKDENGVVTLTLDFAPSKEYIFVITPEDEGIAPEEAVNYTKSTELAQITGYTLDEQNVCVLDMAKFKIGNEDWRDKLEVLKIDRAVRTHYGMPFRGGEMVQPWYAGKTVHEKKDTVKMLFEFDVKVIPQGETFLVMERPENFTVSLNGKPVDLKNQKGFWVDNAFIKVALDNSMFVQGKNELLVSVVFDESINIEALYLVGDFGVAVCGHDATLIEVPQNIGFGDLSEMGFPFYSGKITYHLAAPAVSGKAKVCVPEFEGACLVVNPDAEHKIIPWRPLETTLENPEKIDVQLVLTRRNTFGPLHDPELLRGGYGPDNFVLEGEGWMDDYHFYPAGIFKAPVLWTE